MKQVTTTMGGLECRVVDRLPDGQRPALAVVLCHGYGATGTDLVPLAGEVLRLEPALRQHLRFVFPAAPLPLAGPFYDARAWWHLDVERITRAMATGKLLELADDQPEGLPKARRMLMALLDALMIQTGLPMSRIVVGGFSQGAMLSTDLVLRLEEAPAALCVMSGTLLMASEWRRRAPKRVGLRVLQSHGRTDELLPFEAAVWLRDLFLEAGLQVEFVPFDEGHTIPMEVVERLAAQLKSLVVPE